jgi:hypothetical protein
MACRGCHGLSFSMSGASDQVSVSSLDEHISEADARLYRAKAECRRPRSRMRGRLTEPWESGRQKESP